MAAVRTDQAAGIRPLERADLPQVAALISGSEASSQLASFLEHALLDNPWADSELPSLVYVDDGDIVGTIGASTRRMRFEGRPVRMVCTGFFWAHPRVRHRAVGIQLARALRDGPQDLLVADAATDSVGRMGERLGFRNVHLSSFSFVRIFRPWQLGAGRAGRRLNRRLGRLAESVSSPLDRATMRIARSAFKPPAPNGEVAPLTSAALLENLTVITASVRLHTDYDEGYLEWLFDRLSEIDRHNLFWFRGNDRGELWAELVRRRGRTLGWYVCQILAEGPCRVLQLAVTDSGAQDVIDHLFHGAWKRGSTAVIGRVEPRILAA